MAYGKVSREDGPYEKHFIETVGGYDNESEVKR